MKDEFTLHAQGKRPEQTRQHIQQSFEKKQKSMVEQENITPAPRPHGMAAQQVDRQTHYQKLRAEDAHNQERKARIAQRYEEKLKQQNKPTLEDLKRRTTNNFNQQSTQSIDYKELGL